MRFCLWVNNGQQESKPTRNMLGIIEEGREGPHCETLVQFFNSLSIYQAVRAWTYDYAFITSRKHIK